LTAETTERKTGFHNSSEKRLNSGKLRDDRTQPHQFSRQFQPQLIKCPQCGSPRIWKNGLRYVKDGKTVQRFSCRDCAFRFSEQKISTENELFTWASGQRKQLNNSTSFGKARQVCVSESEMRNLATSGTRQKRVAGATKLDKADVKGKILAYLWHLRKLGRTPETVRNYGQKLYQVLRQGVDLLDPESVKEYLAYKEDWCNSSKFFTATVYDGFLKFQGLTWEKPKYKFTRKIPFIPLENEIDALIACTGKNISTLLQLLKETGMRIGEALRLKWTDIDVERNVVILNDPEKGSQPRIFKVSNTLIGKLNKLPKENERIFRNHIRQSVSSNFRTQRKRIAYKLGNPRLNKITFHTFRHWKATMEYAKTRDILHVMQLLGHRNIRNTLIYTQLIKLQKEDEFYSATAKTTKEAKQLIDDGFEYVCTTPEDVMLFRKRK